MRNFFQLLRALWAQNKFLCVGLDTDYDKLPDIAKEDKSIYDAMLIFNKAIIDKTKDLVCAYKPNFAFYEKYGELGIEVLKKTIRYIHEVAPNVPVILDFKRGDIDNTNNGSVALAKRLGADAITIAPYMGARANKPFLNDADLWVFVLGRTSSEGSGELQDLELANGKKLYEQVIENVVTKWNMNNNCGVVFGATVPTELAAERKKYPNVIFLIPGVGAQGGDLEANLEAGFSPKGDGIIINQSRSILYVSKGIDFAEAAGNEALRVHNAIIAFKEKKFSKAAA